MTAIYSIQEYRRRRMSEAAKNEAPRTKTKEKVARTPHQSLRMKDAVFEAWGEWCKASGMTYEESIVFLVKSHPIDAKEYAERVARKVQGAIEAASSEGSKDGVRRRGRA